MSEPLVSPFAQNKNDLPNPVPSVAPEATPPPNMMADLTPPKPAPTGGAIPEPPAPPPSPFAAQEYQPTPFNAMDQFKQAGENPENRNNLASWGIDVGTVTAGQIGGAAAGTAAGAALGAGGPATAMMGVAGAAMGAPFAGWVGDNLKQIAQIKDADKRDLAERSMWRAIEGVTGQGLALGGLAIAKYFAKNRLEKAAVEGFMERATELQVKNAQDLAAGAEEFGIKLKPHQLFPDDPHLASRIQEVVTKYPQLSALQATQNMQVIDAYENMLSSIGDKARRSGLGSYVKQLGDEYASTIAGLQRKAIQASRQRTFFNEAAQIKDALRQALEDAGAVPEYAGSDTFKLGGGYALPEGTQALHNQYLKVLNFVNREKAFGATGGHVPEFEAIETASAHPAKEVQQALTTPEQGEFWMPGAKSNALPPSSAKEAGTFVMEKQAAQKAKGLTSEKTFETTHNQEGLPLQIKLDEKTGTALLPPNPAGKAEGGMTLQAVEDLRNTLKRLGNYDKVGDLTPGEMAARKAYHDIVPIRDDINMKVFKEAGDNVSAQELRFYRDMNKEQRDSLDRLSDLIAKKPIESWKVLLDPSKPEVIHDFYEVAPDSVKKTIKATLLDNMGDPYITASKPGQSPAFGAKAISKEWDKFPMELKQRMYTYEERTAIDGFLSVARAVENRPIPTAPGGAGAGMIGKMLSYLSRPGASALRDADKLMARVFASRPDILESLQGRLATMSVGKSKAYVLQSAQRAAEAEERLRTGNVLGLRGILGGYSPGVLPSAFGEGINKQ